MSDFVVRSDVQLEDLFLGNEQKGKQGELAVIEAYRKSDDF